VIDWRLEAGRTLWVEVLDQIWDAVAGWDEWESEVGTGKRGTIGIRNGRDMITGRLG